MVRQVCAVLGALGVVVMAGMAPAADPAVVAPAPAQTGDATQPITCLFAPNRSSAIGIDRIGLINKVAVRRADHVVAGQLLLSLDPADAQAEIVLRQVSVDGLRQKIARSAALVAQNLAPAEELEQMQTDLRVAEATLAQARLMLDKTRVTAPYGGVISEVMVAEGELTGTAPLMRLMETDQLRAEMDFVDQSFGQMRLGQSVELVAPLTGARVQAKVTAIDPFLDPNSNTFHLTATVDNRDNRIPVGVGCQVVRWQP